MKRALLLYALLTFSGAGTILGLVKIAPHEFKGTKTTGIVRDYIRIEGSRTRWRPVIELTSAPTDVRVPAIIDWRSKWYDVGETIPILTLPGHGPLAGSFIVRWSFVFWMLLIFSFCAYQIIKTLRMKPEDHRSTR
ncbi:hypothetical protein CMV30_02825 [Nibricoccus aquaticus]|uniref:Uncharacterized protein n=1 Tax=Nibricoccus aquaticus TaxID=2576891 RepID=A0A290QGG9_9BACT|nr:hypothetical protein CMV30_02825 [Nibricoccus aquaticus]